MISPLSLLDQLLIPKGSRVVDIGFGSSKELLALSNIVGDAGVVYGIERSRSRVKRVEVELGVANVRLFAGDAIRMPLLVDSVDMVLFKGVLHEVKQIEEALLEAKRICYKGGRIVIVDFSSFPMTWMKQSNLRWRLRHSLEDPWIATRSTCRFWQRTDSLILGESGSQGRTVRGKRCSRRVLRPSCPNVLSNFNRIQIE